ncbi:hypothetical protein QBC43DRAFT_227784 [Cladorrhinum sp. PSN259]|nr:hypothetical protein QBC43DRAFT_227784 [Cladorrhinum sp. PSN259]
MASSTTQALFYCLWQDHTIRERLFELLSKQDLAAVRVVNSACCNLVTKRLFVRINVTFTANTFTRPSRIQALTRIAHHIEHLSFNFPHSNATFLPPLVHPQTGQEILFLYNPHTSMESALTRPKYGNSELGEILTQQYPPLFHAASNVPSFINAVKHVTNMRHLTIKTPGQEPSERYRRDIVDYALISLRIAVERSPLDKLNKLSLAGVHPAAFNYLRHKSGFGTIPSAALRWQQIKKLYISVESWDFYGPSPGLDHLKIIDDYIRDFAPHLDKFAFSWLGRRGPCPIALAGDPLFASPRTSKKLFNEVTSPMSPLPPRPARNQLVMPRLRCMSVRNATMNAPQLKDLIVCHRETVREFDFENVALVRGGSWEEALAPLTVDESEAWSRKSMQSESSGSIRPSTPKSNSHSSGAEDAVSGDDGDLPTPSPAAEAASRELFEVDLEGFVFGGVNDVGAFEVGVEEWAMGITGDLPENKTFPAEVQCEGYDSGLASDLEAARQASEGFSTKLLKRRKKRRTHHKDHDHSDDERKTSSSSSRSQKKETTAEHLTKSSSKISLKTDRSRSHHKHSRSADQDSRSPSHHRSHRRHHRRHPADEQHHTPTLPSMPSMPEVIGTDDESHFQHNKPTQTNPLTPPRSRPSTPPKSPRPSLTGTLSHAFFRPLTPPTTPPKYSPRPNLSRQSSALKISIPIHPPSSFPVLLQPTIYDPSSRSGPFLPQTSSTSPRDTLDLSPTQRTIEEDIKREEAEAAAARSSALKRAREAVINKLSKQFQSQQQDSKTTPERRHYDGSAAVRRAGGMELGGQMMTQGHGIRGHNNNGSHHATSHGLGQRIREGLFGRSVANVTGGGGHHHHHHHGYGNGNHGNASVASVVVVPDHRSLDSQSALVPLIFSRT